MKELIGTCKYGQAGQLRKRPGKRMTFCLKWVKTAFTVFAGLATTVLLAGQGIASSYDSLVEQLRSDDWHEHFSRETGGKTLDQSLDGLLDLANNGGLDWRIRIRGIILLSETSGPRKVDILLNMFRDSFFNGECPAVKTTIVTALGRVGKDPRIVAALIDGTEDRELQVREASVIALGKMGDQKAVPSLIRKLDDTSFAIRLGAVKALAGIKDKRAIPYIKKIADTDRDDVMRKEARSALAKLKS